MAWTDDQLAGHKRAQGYISSAGATLGIAALGAAGLKNKQARKGAVKLARVANKTSPKAGAKIIRGQRKVANSAQGLTIGSAGVGGIGGYNFAAIQSQEAKRAKAQKVSKNMSTSAWGIDHGVDISKGWDDLDRKTKDKVFASTVSGPYQGFTRGKKGKKLRSAGRIAGQSLAGSAVGAAPGIALTAATKGRSGTALTSLGSAAGGAAGAVNAVEGNHRKGYYKKKP